MNQIIKDFTSNKSVSGDITVNILKEYECTFPVLTILTFDYWLFCISVSNKSVETDPFLNCLKEANATPSAKLLWETFLFYTWWFSKSTEYPIRIIKVSSFLTIRGGPKRICWYNFIRLFESTWYYTTLRTNSQIWIFVYRSSIAKIFKMFFL